MTAARLDLRLDANDKHRIAHAAEVRGVSVSTFVRASALEAADNVISSEAVTLSPEEAGRLLAAMDKTYSHNPQMDRAVREHRAVTFNTATTKAAGGSLAAQLRGRATKRLRTDEIMQLTRDA